MGESHDLPSSAHKVISNHIFPHECLLSYDFDYIILILNLPFIFHILICLRIRIIVIEVYRTILRF